jgi:two-component system cell cycle response regulator
MRDRVLTPNYSDEEQAQPIWGRPDPALAAAGMEGETVVARVRVVAMMLLMIAPTWNILNHPGEAMHVTGFSVTALATVIAVMIWRGLVRGRWQPWIGFASSAFDVTMVSTALTSFYIVSSPMAALNSTVTFEMYFLAITATSLRYDARVCIVAGAMAIVQYGGLWLVAGLSYDLADPALAAATGPYIPIDLSTRLILLAIATLLAVTLVRRAQRLLYLAARDRLSGLFNRRHFDRALADAIAISGRTGHPLSLAILDIDFFKRINDEHGHAIGDLAIRAVADKLLAAMRRTDVVARYGGEEFVVLMPNTPPDGALQRIETIRAELAATPLRFGAGTTVPLNFSAGIVGTPIDGTSVRSRASGGVVTPEALLIRADERLLAAKRAGRGQCVGPPAQPA